MGEKRWKAWVLMTELSEKRAVVRLKSGEGGCSVVVDFGREGFYASYTRHVGERVKISAILGA
jgi:hypothetical protein